MMPRPKIAALVTEYWKHSHAQHIVDRFLFGYGWGSCHHKPAMDLVALYTDHVPESDLSRGRAELCPWMKIYPTIAEALTLGGEQLAVDGVLIIGEHGVYPINAKGQTLYPRYEFFKQVEAVFRDSGRSVPVFNDKHLSWNFDWAQEMVAISKELGFAFMAGSSLPVTTRTPPLEMPLGTQIEETLALGMGGVDSYDIHAIETMQCLVERRRGGETGVAAIHALKDDAVWEALRAGSWEAGGWDPKLFEACMCRSHSLGLIRDDEFNHRLPTLDEIPEIVTGTPVAYRIEYNDGLKATMLLLNGLVKDMSCACRVPGRTDPISTLMYLHPQELCNFFSPLVHHAEQMFLTGEVPYPIERNLLTTGMVASGVESLYQGQKRLATPHLAIAYQPNPASTFLRPAPGDAVSKYEGTTPTVRSIEPHDSKRKKIAIIATIWKHLSHAQHFGDRFLNGYPRNGKWHRPNMDVVSLYVDQKPEGDQSQSRADEFGFTVYPTIAKALRCGGDKLAVDAVLTIGEHGDYPSNDKGQILYPRYEFFEQVVKVFEEDGRTVPVFNDKHLSYSFEHATQMVAASKRLGFGLLSGSSLPVTWRLPAIELPLECEIEEALMVGCGGSDATDYHALEALQCMLERRRGGETGVKSVQLLEGDAVWQAGDAGQWSWRLLEAALSRSDALKGLTDEDARTQDLAHNGELPKIVNSPGAYLIEYNDGLRATLLMLNGAVEDFTFAARVKGFERTQSTQFFLGPRPNVTYSACFAANIEHLFETGQPAYCAERNQIVCGILERCLESRISDHQQLATPELNVCYHAIDMPPIADTMATSG
jgi:hypothetical protein